MFKKLLIVLTIIIISFSFVGCGDTYKDAKETKEDFANGYFTLIKEWEDAVNTYYIVYADNTKVKYLVVKGTYRYGITPLYNADGTLQIYEEE